MFRFLYYFDRQAIHIFKAESGLKQHAKTQMIFFGFEPEIPS